MMKALWFIVQVGIVVAGFIWIAAQPGTVTFIWQDYTITAHAGLFFLCATLFILACIFTYAAVRALMIWPRHYRQKRRMQRLEKGYRSLTRGMSAIAARDPDNAQREWRAAQKYLSAQDHPLVFLLGAQVARLQGDVPGSQQCYTALLGHEDGHFLGIRGLLQDALQQARYQDAATLLERALKAYPKKSWLLETAYRVYTAQKNWDGARRVLKKKRHVTFLSPAEIKQERAAIILAELADDKGKQLDDVRRALKKACRIAPDFLPATLALLSHYEEAGDRRPAIALIKKSWARTPHPDLARIWMALIPVRSAGKPPARMRWADKLIALNPQAPAGYIAAARTAMEDGLWGPARRYLEKAEARRPDQAVYHLLAALDRRSGQDTARIKAWDHKAQNAAMPPAWVCSETGRHFKTWQPFSQSGHFNTIRWTDHEDSRATAVL